MTRKQQKQILKYLRECAEQMALRDWTLILELKEPPDENSAAAVKAVPGRKHAIFRFCAEFWDYSPQTQRETVAHELIHLHLAAAQRLVDFWGEEGLIPKLAMDAFELNFEYGIDGIADAWSKVLPLPNFKR